MPNDYNEQVERQLALIRLAVHQAAIPPEGVREIWAMGLEQYAATKGWLPIQHDCPIH